MKVKYAIDAEGEVWKLYRTSLGLEQAVCLTKNVPAWTIFDAELRVLTASGDETPLMELYADIENS